jgi:uncharacterized protein YecT (DUF1311 family)
MTLMSAARRRFDRAGQSEGGRRPAYPDVEGSAGRLQVMRIHKKGATTALVLVLGLPVAVPTVAAALSRPAANHASARALTPPVIPEKFSPTLPCDPNTTVGMEGCGEHKVLAADAQLDADVKVIFGLWKGDDLALRQFVTAQTTWLAYRNADCTSQSNVYQGGSEQPVAYVYCLAGDDASRRQDLKAFFAGWTQGRTGVAKFP